MTAGDTRQFKATLLILQGSEIGIKLIRATLPILQGNKIGIGLFMPIFQLQSQPHPNCYSKGNAVEIPPLIPLTMSRLKVVEADDEESKQTPLRLHDH
jgi:hypothetical protein